MVFRRINIFRFLIPSGHKLEAYTGLFLSLRGLVGELPPNKGLKFKKNTHKRFRFVFTLILALLLCVLLEQNVYAAWYNSSWLYRQKITISPTVTDADLANYPYLVKITDPTNPVFANAQTDGDDILFTSSDETTKLNHEIEKYDSTNKELWVWINVPAISSTVNTEIYLYGSFARGEDNENLKLITSK